MLTKHRVVLRWYESMNRGFEYHPGERRTPTGPQVFVAEEAPQGAMFVGTVVRLEYDAWQDMGGPAEITVTVEPGDLLNGE